MVWRVSGWPARCTWPGVGGWRNRHIGGHFGAADTAADHAAWYGGNRASFAGRETPVAGQRNRAAPAGWQARFAPWLRATLRSEHAYRRLRRIKASLDPHDMIRYNNPVPPVQRQFT